MTFEQRMEGSVGECLWMSRGEYVSLKKSPEQNQSLPRVGSMFHSELDLRLPIEFL